MAGGRRSSISSISLHDDAHTISPILSDASNLWKVRESVATSTELHNTGDEKKNILTRISLRYHTKVIAKR